jgi:hypothetical protein
MSQDLSQKKKKKKEYGSLDEGRNSEVRKML